MIGTKKLSEIKRELRQALGNDQELAAWLDRQISRPSQKAGSIPTVEKDLLWVRQLLRKAVAPKKTSCSRSETAIAGKLTARDKPIGLWNHPTRQPHRRKRRSSRCKNPTACHDCEPTRNPG